MREGEPVARLRQAPDAFPADALGVKRPPDVDANAPPGCAAATRRPLKGQNKSGLRHRLVRPTARPPLGAARRMLPVLERPHRVAGVGVPPHLRAPLPAATARGVAPRSEVRAKPTQPVTELGQTARANAPTQRAPLAPPWVAARKAAAAS